MTATAAGSRLLTLRETAERLGLSEKTLYGWRVRRSGPSSFRMGNRVRYRETDVEAWITEQEARDDTRRANG